MIVLKEIMEWSQSRPAWQRDGLRRLLLNGVLSGGDLDELTEICKSQHGLSDVQEFIPLTKEHMPDLDSELAKVTLISIYHHRGVNALADNQTLYFANGITIIYGDNAAGKTGYIRILKNACRSRGQEDILGNVVSGGAPLTPDVAIKYKVGLDEGPREWPRQREDDYISRISVFDSQCASVYLTEKTDVAFRPFGLDLFDKLVQACKNIRTKLERERGSYSLSVTGDLLNQIPEGTSVAKLVTGITSLTKPEQVHEIAQLSQKEEERLVGIEKSLLDLQTKNPEKLVSQLRLLEARIRKLTRHLAEIEQILSIESVKALFDAKNEAKKKNEEAKLLREATFYSGVLEGTGTELWVNLWEAARRFSQELAYPGSPFPVIENGARCVFCQQELNADAGIRLKQFEAFITSTIEKELRGKKSIFEGLLKSFIELEIKNNLANELIEEIRIENAALSDSIALALENNEKRYKFISDVLDSGLELGSDCPLLSFVSSKANLFADQIDERINVLQGSLTDEKMQVMKTEVEELRARIILANNKDLVLNEIERKKKVAAYGLCIDDTRTHSITQKNTAITRAAITKKLKQSFQEELSKLSFKHLEVALEEAGGSEGILFHKLMLTRAPGVEVPRVASEGEQRCLSIAAFFAELSTADDPSGIVFDDPVSSLDYKWREGVANRLVGEAKHRQVIVFTHDIVFLLLLKQYSEEQDVEQLDQYVCQLPIGTGVCTQDLPWVALKVSKRISFLNKRLQDAEKHYHDGHQEIYEREAGFIYGLLRETWERGIEEVLLGGIVERYRNGVQTQQIAKIADITEEDCKAVEIAMKKCSKWLVGHDQAAAARADMPEPSELKKDIEVLDSWVKDIRKRRR